MIDTPVWLRMLPAWRPAAACSRTEWPYTTSVASPAGSTPQVAVMAEVWDSGWVWQQVNTPVCGLAEYEGEPRNAPSKLANSC